MHSAHVTPLLITSYFPDTICVKPDGNRAMLMSILNKQDYARWHGYEFHLGARTYDPSLRPPGSPEAHPSSHTVLHWRIWLLKSP